MTITPKPRELIEVRHVAPSLWQGEHWLVVLVRNRTHQTLSRHFEPGGYTAALRSARSALVTHRVHADIVVIP